MHCLTSSSCPSVNILKCNSKIHITVSILQYRDIFFVELYLHYSLNIIQNRIHYSLNSTCFYKTKHNSPSRYKIIFADRCKIFYKVKRRKKYFLPLLHSFAVLKLWLYGNLWLWLLLNLWLYEIIKYFLIS